MSLLSHIQFELNKADLNASEKQAILDCYEVWDKEGHSGGSAGILISWLNNWNERGLEAITDPSSMLYGYWMVIKDLPPSIDRFYFMSCFIRAVSFRPLTPLTGSDDEWVDHGHGHLQNTRMSSVFKEPGKQAHWLDGRIFYTPSCSNRSFTGFTNYASCTTIEFPWLPPKKPERVFYAHTDVRVELENEEKANHWLEGEFLLTGAGYVNNNVIDPKAFFIQPDDFSLLEEWFYFIAGIYSVITHDARMEILDILESATWSDAYEEGEATTILTGKLKGIIIPCRFIIPLKRIFATTPNNVKLVDGKLRWYRDMEIKLLKKTPMRPTRHFQDWEPVKANEKRNLTECTFSVEGIIDGKSRDAEAYFDFSGWLTLSVDYDHLYQMRRKFKLKHPERKTVSVNNDEHPAVNG